MFDTFLEKCILSMLHEGAETSVSLLGQSLPASPASAQLYKDPSLGLATLCDLVGLNKPVKLIQFL